MLSRSAITISLTASLVWTLVNAGCGRQVDGDYLGELLLRIRGEVTSNALKDRPQAVPALCFNYFTGDSTLGAEHLPADVVERLGSNLEQGSPFDTHIVDVESHGNFPAEFAVDVYLPPDPSTLAPLATGEPPSAFGFVCAVKSDHAAKVRELSTMGASVCTPGEGCSGFNLRMNRDSSRYYLERYACPDAAESAEDCEVTPEGDATLKLENGGAESVFEANYDGQIIYLAEPAAAGSYTAYKAGAPDGLSAGYHVRSLPKFSEDTPESCFGSWYDATLAELNAKYNTSYGIESEIWAAGNREQIESYRDIQARLEMEACPIENVTTERAETDKLSLKLTANDYWLEPTWRVEESPGEP